MATVRKSYPAEFRRDVLAVAQEWRTNWRSGILRCTRWSQAAAQLGEEPGFSLCTWRICAIVTTVLVLSDGVGRHWGETR
jgi:hypothetical protein